MSTDETKYTCNSIEQISADISLTVVGKGEVDGHTDEEDDEEWKYDIFGQMWLLHGNPVYVSLSQAICGQSSLWFVGISVVLDKIQ